jgi:hypothetical protein
VGQGALTSLSGFRRDMQNPPKRIIISVADFSPDADTGDDVEQ